MPVEVGGVAAGETGGAEGGAAGGAEEGIFRQIIQGVGADEGADFLDALRGADQLFLRACVDAVETGPGVFRAGNQHVHFLRSGISHKFNNLS